MISPAQMWSFEAHPWRLAAEHALFLENAAAKCLPVTGGGMPMGCFGRWGAGAAAAKHTLFLGNAAAKCLPVTGWNVRPRLVV